MAIKVNPDGEFKDNRFYFIDCNDWLYAVTDNNTVARHYFNKLHMYVDENMDILQYIESKLTEQQNRIFLSKLKDSEHCSIMNYWTCDDKIDIHLVPDSKGLKHIQISTDRNTVTKYYVGCDVFLDIEKSLEQQYMPANYTYPIDFKYPENEQMYVNHCEVKTKDREDVVHIYNNVNVSNVFPGFRILLCGSTGLHRLYFHLNNQRQYDITCICDDRRELSITSGVMQVNLTNRLFSAHTMF